MLATENMSRSWEQTRKSHDLGLPLTSNKCLWGMVREPGSNEMSEIFSSIFHETNDE
jgi:hypothetical protein